MYVAFGSNQPFGTANPALTVQVASQFLVNGGARFLSGSGLWASEPWPPGRGGPGYINAVAAFDWPCGNPDQLMSLLATVERRLGRVRDPADPYGPRTIDLDLIAYGDRLIGQPPRLVVPHPRAHSRDFVLAPLLEIDPHWRHPASGTPGAVLLDTARAALAADGQSPARRIAGGWT